MNSIEKTDSNECSMSKKKKKSEHKMIFQRGKNRNKINNNLLPVTYTLDSISQIYFLLPSS